ncbi:hypothetical protein PAXINDRAFT_14248 [Paxillus involutus ATCC 200175]|uniref:Uncharacterized protein n=1 Tax=Paxillus involutus ATCC 200175 TaxID=664439 RepID=A0A0C9TZA0_PAXIN|nr:hypothetical protein PAXINDRAFT_14248 [Paxillus involutus ATCC 200175]
MSERLFNMPYFDGRSGDTARTPTTREQQGETRHLHTASRTQSTPSALQPNPTPHSGTHDCGTTRTNGAYNNSSKSMRKEGKEFGERQTGEDRAKRETGRSWTKRQRAVHAGKHQRRHPTARRGPSPTLRGCQHECVTTLLLRESGLPDRRARTPRSTQGRRPLHRHNDGPRHSCKRGGRDNVPSFFIDREKKVETVQVGT